MSSNPPCPTFASRHLARVLPLVGERSRRSSWATALTMAAVTIAFQYASPGEASAILLYLLLTAQAVWFLGPAAGMSLTVVTVLVGGLAAHAMGGGTQSVALQMWNIGSRLLSIGLLGFVLAGLRRALEVERWRATTDLLTGALNKGAFEAALDATVRRAEAQGEALVLAYMDLDGFKAVNDRHGHSAGNYVLTRFASGAAAALRSSDRFARIGGDEFVAMLTVPSCVEGDHVAESLHRRLSAILAATGFPVTVSMGALVMEARHMAQEDDIIEQADRLMYLAKDAGKNTLRIGRGAALEGVLRTAFPIVPTVHTIDAMLGWVDHADTPPLRRTG